MPAAMPQDLIPLPTAPYPERPISMPLDVQECRTAIWRCRGNITDAANLLKVPSQRLRMFVRGSPYLSAEVEEARQQLADIAEDVVYEALTDEVDAGRRDSMAKFVLTSQIGRQRGYGNSGGGASVNINSPKGPVHISWGDGSSLSTPEAGSDATLIEGKVVDNDDD